MKINELNITFLSEIKKKKKKQLETNFKKENQKPLFEK